MACTDVGTRVAVAIRLDKGSICHNERQADGSVRTWTEEIDLRQHPEWLAGPPYAVAEEVFDEYELETCEPVEDVENWKPDPLPQGVGEPE